MKKVLIVDDEPDVAQLMQMLVQRGGYQADWTHDPLKALDMMKGYDILLLDIMMPRMSGRAVLAEMKKRGINIPVIVVSAVGLPMEVGQELSSNYPGVEFVSKTDMHTDMVKIIEQKIGK